MTTRPHFYPTKKIADLGNCLTVEFANREKHVFVSTSSRTKRGAVQELRALLEGTRAACESEGTPDSIIQQTVFVDDPIDRVACQQEVEKAYGSRCPATSYVVQKSCSGGSVSLETWAVAADSSDFTVEYASPHIVVRRNNGVSWVHFADVAEPTDPGGVYSHSAVAFETMARQLKQRRIPYDQVVRTWLYLGDIVGAEGDTQRYKELNRARTDFYRKFRFHEGHVPKRLNGSVFPASTGIGMDGRDVVMSCLALTTDRSDVRLMPLENPSQTSAFLYGPHYSPKSPKFARAMAVCVDDAATTLVSGTASITESESRFPDDPERQTHQTLDNIEVLISPENFRRHGLDGLGSGLEGLAQIRVYVKRLADYEAVRQACEDRVGDCPAVYVIADVCRPELLVEIEGIAFSRRSCPQT